MSTQKFPSPEEKDVRAENIEDSKDDSLIKEKHDTIQAETHDAAEASLERCTEKRFTFTEATELLQGKLDLEAALTSAVSSHERWGFLEYLTSFQKRKLKELERLAQTTEDAEEKESILASLQKLRQQKISNADDYKFLFCQVAFGEAQLQKVLKNIEDGKKVAPIFDIGHMTLAELFHALIVYGVIPYEQNKYFKKLANIRRINPGNIPDLENLARKSSQEQYAAFQAAYKLAKPLELTGPRIAFTLDEHQVTHTGTSPIEDLQALAKGEIALLDPIADLFRYRTQIDDALRKVGRRGKKLDQMSSQKYLEFVVDAFLRTSIDKHMPDSEKITRYPHYVFEDGCPVYITFAGDLHATFVGASYPEEASDTFGYRVSIE